MNEQDIKNFFAKSGQELANLVLSGFVSKVSEELSVVVTRAQRGQGEAEAATAEAQAKLTTVERTIVEKKAMLAELTAQVRGLRAECDTLTPERDALKIELEALRTERLQHAHDALKILQEQP